MTRLTLLRRLVPSIVAVLLMTTDARARTIAWTCSIGGFKEPLTYLFDTTTSQGTMVGNAGTAALIAHFGDKAISFVENIVSGVVQSTTIKLDTNESVHSRHTIMGDRFVVSQNKGTCERKE